MRLLAAKRIVGAGYVQGWWVIGIIFLSLLIRLYKLTNASVWSDEAFTLELITYPPRRVWILSGQDVHPPLYYLVLQGWVELVGSNALIWVRGLSVVFGTLHVGLIIWLMLLISTRRAAMIAGLLLAFLPIAVRYSQDVRMYALLGTFMLGATIALVYWVKFPAKKYYLVIYVLLMVAGFYTHYFSIFCAGSHWLYLLLIRLPQLGRHRHIQRPGWWLANVMMAILYIPWLPSMLRQFARFGRGWIQPLSIESVPSVIWKFLTANDGHAHYDFIFWSLPLLYLILAMMAIMRDGGKYKFNVLVVVCGFLTIVVTVVVSLITPVFVERYVFFSALMLPAIIALALERTRRAAPVVIAVFFILGVEVYGLVNIYSQQHALNNPYRIADNQLGRLMSYFKAASISGDVLVVGDVYIFYAAKFYDAKNRKIVLYTPPRKDGASARPNGIEFYAPMFRYTDDTYIDNLDQLLSESQRVWLLPFTDQLTEDRVRVPGTWRLIRHEAGGDNMLNLYLICSPQTSEFSEVCE